MPLDLNKSELLRRNDDETEIPLSGTSIDTGGFAR